MAARVSRDREFSPLGMEYATLFPCTRDIIRVIERVCIRFVTHVAVLKFAHWAIYLRDNRAGSRFVPSWKWAICPPGQFSVQFVTVFELISVVTEARRACWRRFWKYVIGQRCYLYLCCGFINFTPGIEGISVFISGNLVKGMFLDFERLRGC